MDNEAFVAGRFARCPDALARSVLDTVLVLGTKADEPIIVDGTARLAWDLLSRPVRGNTIVDEIVTRYGADPIEVRADVAAFLCELEALGVVDRVAWPA